MLQNIKNTGRYVDTFRIVNNPYIAKNSIDFYIGRSPYNHNGTILFEITTLLVKATNDTKYQSTAF